MVATSRHADLLLKHAGLATRAGDAAWREFLVRQALSAAPQDLNVLMEMSAMLQSRRQLPEALAYLKQHEALAPGDHHALVQQGKVLADLGRFSDAEAGPAPRRRGPRHDGRVQPGHGARSAGALGRGAPALRAGAGHRSLQQQRDEQPGRRPRPARRDGGCACALRAGDQHRSRPAEYYTNYGNALIQARRLDDAVGALAIAITLDPRDANAHNNLGIALAQQQRLDLARQAFERALQHNPSHVNAQRNLELTLRI